MYAHVKHRRTTNKVKCTSKPVGRMGRLNVTSVTRVVFHPSSQNWYRSCCFFLFGNFVETSTMIRFCRYAIVGGDLTVGSPSSHANTDRIIFRNVMVIDGSRLKRFDYLLSLLLGCINCLLSFIRNEGGRFYIIRVFHLTEDTLVNASFLIFFSCIL